MTKSLKPQLTAAALACALLSVAGAANADAPGYVSSTSDSIVTSAYGLCWKTSYWNPGEAVSPCDAAPAAQVRAPAPVAAVQPEPAPAPAPRAELAPPTQAPIIEKVSLSSDVLFEFDKATLRPQGRDELDKLAERIKDAEVQSILTVGYADPIGPEQYNRKLSQSRADAVRQYLATKGIDESRMQIEGRGETQEFTEGRCKGMKGNALIRCLEPNRRVDIEVRGTRVASGEGAPAAGATSGATSGSSSGSAGGASTR